MAWLDCLDWFSGNHSNDATEEAYDTFYAQSALIPEHTPLNEKVVRAYFETMRSVTLDSSQVSVPLPTNSDPAIFVLSVFYKVLVRSY